MKPSLLTAQKKEQRQLTRKIHEVEREVGEATVRHWTKAEILAKWADGRYDVSKLAPDSSVFPRLPKVRRWE